MRGVPTRYWFDEASGVRGMHHRLAMVCRGSREFVARLTSHVALALAVSTVIATLCSVTPSVAQQPAKTPSAFPQQPGGAFGQFAKPDKSKPMLVQADELIYDNKNNRVTAKGNVEIYYNDYVLLADQVIYDQNTDLLYAIGNVRARDPNGNVQSSDSFVLTADFKEGFVDALKVVAKDDSRIAAQRAVRQDGGVTVYENAAYTPCKPCKDNPNTQLWGIRATRIIHNQTEGNLSYQDAQFELFGIPVLYLPYFAHPDPSVKRKTGFLMPEYHNSSTLGFGVTVPYFFNLSPSFDFTFAPTYWSRQGVLYNGEWRQRLINGEYNIKLAAIDQQAAGLPAGLSPTDINKQDGFRGTLQTAGKFQFGSWWNLGWDVTLETDSAFRRYYGFDSASLTERVNKLYFEGISDRNYFGTYLYDLDNRVYPNAYANQKVLPSIDYNVILDQPVLGGELSFNLNAFSLTRRQGAPTALLSSPFGIANNLGSYGNTNQVVAEAKWRKQIIDPIGQVWTPFASVRGDVYQISDLYLPSQNLTIGDATITRANATAGLQYQYPFAAVTADATHIVEPIGQIVTRPNTSPTSQWRIPNEDARSLVFDDTDLFSTDKFSGRDRMETGTRLNSGVQYTFQLNSGGYARALAGQSYQVSGDNPFATTNLDPLGVQNFSVNSGLQRNASDYVTAFYIAPTQYFRLISQQRFDEGSLTLQRQDTALQANWGPATANATYSFTKADPNTTLVSTSATGATITTPATDQREISLGGSLKLTDVWSISASTLYDIQNSKVIQDTGTIKYSDECFVLSVQFTETFITDPTRGIIPDRTVMLRFEFKNLGQYGYNTNISGNQQSSATAGGLINTPSITH